MTTNRFLCLLGLTILCAQMVAAPSVSVDRTDLTTNDTFTLQIKDQNVSDNNPDLTPLADNFNLLSTVVSTEVQSINGKIQQQKTWSIVLAPKHSGTITIPSLKIGADQTGPLSITVTTTATASPTKEAAISNQASVFMQTTIAPKSIYEGQAGLYTVKIFYNTTVRQPSLMIPDLGNAKLIHLGKDTSQRTTVNGENYQVLEQHYAVIAQQDGILTIKSPILQGSRLNLMRKDGFNDPWEPFKVSAPTSSLKIQTIPGMAKSSLWLPSTKVTLTDSWADSPPQFQSGIPVTRTLTLTAQNVTAEQLPTIAPAKNNGFQLYADKPLLNTDSNGFQLQASRSEKIAYLPNVSGPVTIPAITLDWWDTDSNRPKKVRIPEYTFTVSGNKNNAATDHNTDLIPTVLSHDTVTIAPENKRLNWYKKPSVILSILLGLAWVITMLLWWHTTKPKLPLKTPPLHHHEGIKTVRQARRDLKMACQQNNALDAKAALLSIGKILWPYETLLSVGDLIEKFQKPQTKELLQELESVLYKEATIWHGAQLWALLDEEFRTKAKASINPDDVLPHLYLGKKQP